MSGESCKIVAIYSNLCYHQKAGYITWQEVFHMEDFIGGYIFFGLIALVCHIALCYFCGSLAEEKGHSSSSYCLLCIFFGVIGFCIVAALPDLKMRETLSGIEYKLRQLQSQSAQPPVEPVSNTQVQHSMNSSVLASPAGAEERLTPIVTIAAEDGDIICPSCSTKQKSSRRICWNCGQKFLKD